VYGWAEMLVRRKDPESVPRAAFEVLDSAEQAVALINDLLDLSRLDEDRLKLVIRPVEPRLIVHQAIRRVLPAAEMRQVRLEEETDPDLPPIETDSHRVEQILTNLFTNAIKHSPPGTRITLTAGREGESTLFAVQDEGPGIPPGEEERIFDIYSTKPGTGGVGLGLPLSRRLARLLGGTLEVDSGCPCGARFVLRLPTSRS
jgi:NtrC-family two-component system sensor histidine kinase KinB